MAAPAWLLDGRPLRWGIIGCGDVTEKKSGPGFQRASGSELAAVMRRDATKAADYAERHQVPRWHSDVDALLADSSVDAVYIATPPGAHLETALRVAAAGKPCYVEKPMGRSFDEAARMAAAFAEARLPLFVAYYRRAYPRYQQVRALLHTGELGRLTSVSYELQRRAPAGGGGTAGGGGGWRVDVETSGGGLFVDVGSHLLDLLDFLLGPLRDVRGRAARKAPEAPPGAPEDFVEVHFSAMDDIAGTATWDFWAEDDLEVLQFVGDRATLTLPDPMNGVENVLEYADGTPPMSWVVNPPAPSVQEPLIQSVVEAVRAGNASLCPSLAESGLRTAAYIDAVLEGFYGKRVDGYWEDPSTWSVNAGRDSTKDGPLSVSEL